MLDIRTMGQEKSQPEIGMLRGEPQHPSLTMPRRLAVCHEDTDSDLSFHRFEYIKSNQVISIF